MGPRYPLTATQKSMVLALERAPRSGAYLLQDVVEFAGEVHSAELQRAWQQVAARHPVFRTRIGTGPDGELRQAVEESPEFSWNEIDCAATTAVERQQQIDEFLRADRERGFDLSRGVPLRFTLLRDSHRPPTLVWTIHHALTDGRSQLAAWQEWLALYRAAVHGECFALRPAESFYEHVDWLGHQDFSSGAGYWQSCFEGVTQTTDYIVDRTRAARKPGQGGTGKQKVCLSEELTVSLEQFAASHDLTLHTLIQAAWAVLLSRYGNRKEVVYGVTRAVRPACSDERMLGLLINTLPFRIDVSEDMPVLDWLKQIRSRWIDQRPYQHTPAADAARLGGLPPNMPPFESVLVYEHEPPAKAFAESTEQRHGCTFRRVQRTDSPLTLVAYGHPVVSFELIYDPALYSCWMTAQIAGHLRTLLGNIAAGQGSRVADLKMLNADQEDWLIHRLHQRRTLPPHALAHGAFERYAARTPEQIAFEGGDTRISYDQANRQANRLARVVRARGAGANDIVCVLLPRLPEAVTAIMAVLKAGAAFLALDPDLPALRLEQMIADAGPKAVVTSWEYLPALGSYSGPVVDIAAMSDATAEQADDNLSDCAAPDNAAYAVYTSGSTGKPKAPVLPHRALVNHTESAVRIYGIQSSDRRLQCAPIGTDVFVAEVMNTLSAGATLVFGLNPQGNSIEEFSEVLEDRRITVTSMPASRWTQWVTAMLEGHCAPPSSLRVLVVGMERVDAGVFQAWSRLVQGRVRWFNGYGPAETSPTASIYEAGCSEWECETFLPIGKPHPNTQAYVLDERMRPAPVGVPGELYIGGDGVALGYLNAPDLTAQRFLPDTLGGREDARLYKSGDRVFRLPDGNLVFIGRLDRQVKIRGFRVELEEIEAVLYKHPNVRQCAVVLNDQGKLSSFIYPVEMPETGMQQFRSYLSRHLPDHMIPAAWAVIERMPVTSSGKIDRKALQAIRLEPDSGNREEPFTETERRLAVLWQDVLELPVIGATDDFFQMGGDSLSAARLITRIRNEFQKEVPFTALLRHANIRRLGAWLEGDDLAEETGPGLPYLLPLRTAGDGLPVFCISSAATDAHCFRSIAKSIRGEHPFYALSNPIEDPLRLQTVEELATRIRHTIREIRPQGPYVLGGYCFGGVVAFEAARQLMAQGQDVPLLVLFDALAPGYPKLFQNRTRYLHYARRLFSSRNGSSAIKFADVRVHLRFMVRRFRTRVAAQTQRAAARISPESVNIPVADLSSFMERSARLYRPARISTRIAHFVAGQQEVSSRIVEDPRLGWRDLCTEDFEVYAVPADHGSLFLDQQAEGIGRVFQDLLGRASQHSGV
ncbi:MAG: amino acid adenylation domain-containing protein [Bryobacteraceae bacterium]